MPVEYQKPLQSTMAAYGSLGAAGEGLFFKKHDSKHVLSKPKFSASKSPVQGMFNVRSSGQPQIFPEVSTSISSLVLRFTKQVRFLWSEHKPNKDGDAGQAWDRSDVHCVGIGMHVYINVGMIFSN